jgi:phosphatidate cytidylyltransferase
VTRVLSGLIVLGLVVAAIWSAPEWLFLAVLAVVLTGAVLEYVSLVEKTGLVVPRAAAVTAAVVTAAFVALPTLPASPLLAAVLIAISALTLGVQPPARHVPASVAATVFPSWYLGVPLGLVATLRSVQGREALLFVLVLVVVSDTAQFYVGTRLGRHRLSPAVSPKKSVEGAVGGLVAGAGVAAFGGHVLWPSLGPGWLAAVGVALAALGIIGDLFESLLKRSADVKDSSGLIPGHGGILDRIDSFLLVVPGVQLLLHFLN